MLTVFISYSSDDTKLMRFIESQLKRHGYKTRVWDMDRLAGEPIWPQIDQWIEECDVALIIISRNTIKRGIAVGQEIGKAQAKQKLVIPLHLPEVSPTELGSLAHITCERFDPDRPDVGLRRLMRRLKQWDIQKMYGQFWGVLFFVAGLLFFISLNGSPSAQRPRRIRRVRPIPPDQ